MRTTPTGTTNRRSWAESRRSPIISIPIRTHEKPKDHQTETRRDTRRVGDSDDRWTSSLDQGSYRLTETTQLQTETESIDGLYLDWRETYNGSVLTNTTDGIASPSPTGPAISLGNVLPGDRGSLSVRIRGPPGDDPELEVESQLLFDLVDEAALSDLGLQQFVETSLWYDTGLLEVDSFGARNGD